jgi:glycosyltransferase involved in cell wall biosynthesis
MENPIQLSIVIPYYGCENSLVSLCERLKLEIKKIQLNSEVIFILDGTEGGSWDKLESTTKEYGFRSVKLIRNFGQHAATKAGLSLTKGSKIVILDCDLQDPPELISKMLSEMTSDVDVIFTKRRGDYDSKFRKYSRKFLKLAFKSIYPPNFDLNTGSFMLIRQKVAKQILDLNSPDHVGLLVNWFQYSSKTLEYDRGKRHLGKSSYKFKKLFNHGMEALNFELSHFFKLSIAASFIFSLFSLIVGFYSLVRAIILQSSSGWASIFVVVTLGFSLTLTLLSLIGYTVVQNQNALRKPLFIIDERNG